MSFISDESEPKSEVVVVTGGSGFLGQHIVRALVEQTKFAIQEVRVFDLQPLKWFMEIKVSTLVPLRYMRGDICNSKDIAKAFEGATVVIHNASVVDVTSCPDEEKIKRVNVQGTADVIQACKICNVPVLVYTSSVDALHEGLMGEYGESKRKAEQQILQANGSKLSKGERIFTCALRPVTMYGEGDPNVLTTLRSTVNTNIFFRLGDESGNFQLAYAGNVAESYVLAIWKLTHQSGQEHESNSPDGRAITVSDDTPVQSFNKQLEPFVETSGARMTPFYIPFFILYFLSAMVECFVWVLRPIHKCRFLFTRDTVRFLQNGPVVNYEEATLYLDYKPVYSYEVSLERSSRYLKERIKCNQL